MVRKYLAEFLVLKIVGYNTLSVLPMEEEYCLYHPKDIKRQEKQNAYYETI